jgi:hypothetical protein
VGQVIWEIFITFFLFFTIRISWLTKYQQVFIMWFCIQEILNCVLDAELNTLVVSGIMLSFLLVEKEHDHWATFFIAMGTMTKLFGIVGLAFLPFSRHKSRLLLAYVGWVVVLAVLPMAVFGPSYVWQEYHEWFDVLVHKNELNQFAAGQNISLLGIVRKISGCATYSDLWLVIPGLIAFVLPYLRFGQYQFTAFRQTILASVLMFLILFSTCSESYGYVIAMTGVGIWYTAAPWKRNRWDIALMVFAFIITSMSPSDLFPKPIWRELIKPYSLKALPVVLVWLKLIYELYTRDYDDHHKTKRYDET